MGDFVILKGRNKQSGQSTIEFALTLILLMGFVMFFVQLSLIFGFSNYAHYATFMSARAYLSSSASQDDQLNRAKNVIIHTLKRSDTQSGVDRFPSIAKGVQGTSGDLAGFGKDSPSYSPGDYNLSWLQGITYTFKSKLFLIPLGGTGGASSGSAATNSVTLTSESWLGRDPDDEECVNQLGKVNGLYDNGC